MVFRISHIALLCSSTTINAEVNPSIKLLHSHKAEDCGLCHPNQFQQWKKSFHSRAMGPGVVAQFSLFDIETVEDCLSCHAPARLNKPKHLIDSRIDSEAIGCVSCHEIGGERVGP